MAVKRVTMQDIADACGLSRNTVSKIFNGRGAVPEATKKLVLAKAQELGYMQLPEEAQVPSPVGVKNIALLTQHKLLNHSFGAFFITSFTDAVSRAGYTLKMFEISPDELRDKKLPPHLDLGDTAGIVCIELFDRAYIEMLCDLDLPFVLVDGFAGMNHTLMRCDVVSMESYAVTFMMAQKMLEAGAKRIGFVGDHEHCNSFHERWFSLYMAMKLSGTPLSEEYSIIEPDGDLYGDTGWLVERLSLMPSLPDGFLCANDFLAIHLAAALRQLGVRIPEDVMITGFDGSPESALMEPPLTTAAIQSADVGRIAADVLTERINAPQRPHRRVSVESVPIWRGSTR